MIWDTVCSVGPFLRSLYHWWQLQLLIVRIVTLVSCILLPSAYHFLIQLCLLHLSILRCDSTQVRVSLTTLIANTRLIKHWIDEVKTISSQMSSMNLGTITLFPRYIKWMKMIATVNLRVAIVVTTLVLVLLHWMEVVIASTSSALTEVIASISSVVWTQLITKWSILRIQTNVTSS